MEEGSVDTREADRAPFADRGLFEELVEAPVTRRRILRYGAGAMAGLALPGLLAACGGDDNGGTTTATATGEAPKPTGTIDFFGWEGEDLKGIAPMESFLKANGAQLKSSYTPTLDDITPKLQSTDGIDLLAYTSIVTERLQTSDLLQPLDTAKIPNIDGLLPRWQEDDPQWIENGERLFVPSFFQTFSLMHNSDEVTDPPNDYRGLLEPEFKDKILTWAEPNAAFGVCSDMLGIEQGKVPKDRIDELADLYQQFIDQSKSVAASPGDIVTQIASGEVIAVFLGTPQFTLFANGAGGAGKAVRDVVDIQNGNMSFTDGYGIPAGADNADSAYAFINRVLDPKVNAAISEAFAGGVVVEGAEQFLPSDRRLYPADQLETILESAPLQILAPLESDQYVTQGEWVERFTQLTS
jgi:spermidine/putrescine transport system substrate-binding protein